MKICVCACLILSLTYFEKVGEDRQDAMELFVDRGSGGHLNCHHLSDSNSVTQLAQNSQIEDDRGSKE